GDWTQARRARLYPRHRSRRRGLVEAAATSSERTRARPRLSRLARLRGRYTTATRGDDRPEWLLRVRASERPLVALDVAERPVDREKHDRNPADRRVGRRTRADWNAANIDGQA